MSLTWRDAVATAVTGTLVVGYVGLAQGSSWAPVTSVRWYAVAFLVAGQASLTAGAADLARSGFTRSAGYIAGPVGLVATLLALATGNLLVLGVAVGALVFLWTLTTAHHVTGDHHGQHPGHGRAHA